MSEWNTEPAGWAENCAAVLNATKRGSLPIINQPQAIPSPVYRIARMKGWIDREGSLTPKWADDFAVAMEAAYGMMDTESSMVEHDGE